MNNSEIQQKLRQGHQSFVDLIDSLSDDNFLYARDQKWTAGQQLDHIYRSVSALSTGLTLPKFVIRLYVGKANRPSKDYNSLVEKYKLKLGSGGKAVGRFIPKEVQLIQKNKLEKKLLGAVESLCKKVSGYNENQLDYYILPHPLLGKLTLREMLFFTIYHVEHHHRQTINNLGTAFTKKSESTATSA